MLRCFVDLSVRTIEAYVDDIIFKSKQADQLVADLEQIFTRLRANGFRLNPKNCVFGVPRGMLLGFIVSEHSIKANPDKIAVIARMGSVGENLQPGGGMHPPNPSLG
jgi:hypothetical protein